MQLVELDTGEKFKFKNDIWTKFRKVRTKSLKSDIFDCMNSEGRHRPFRGTTEIEPCQRRIEL